MCDHLPQKEGAALVVTGKGVIKGVVESQLGVQAIAATLKAIYRSSIETHA